MCFVNAKLVICRLNWRMGCQVVENQEGIKIRFDFPGFWGPAVEK